MKRTLAHITILAGAFAFALPAAAQDDATEGDELEVTMDVFPVSEALGENQDPATLMDLVPEGVTPEGEPAPEAQFGLNVAREAKTRGEAFGRDVAEAASAKDLANDMEETQRRDLGAETREIPARNLNLDLPAAAGRP